ncbi:MAG TPA: tetratricopeptide repeat protein, partial [Rhizomicrobium sp.]|nr:tetratricopeptide repeat protein [Rhizomicrobium sp.]
MIRHQWLVFLPMTLATAGLAACASLMESDTVKVRPVESKLSQASAQHDPLYESAVVAINERDYGRALDYLQAAKDKNPGNVKILNALGVVYDKLGRFDLSARYYAQASAIEPDSKIVAENRGYSQVLQRLMNPGAPVAVAAIDLPAGLTAQPAPQKPVAVIAMNSAAPAVLQPEAKPVAATPAKARQPEDYTHQSVTIFTAGSADIASAPIQPEAKWVVAPAIGSVSAKLPAWTAPSLPSPEVGMALRTETEAEPVSASALAMPAKPVIARQEPASAAPPATVVAVLPPERTVAYHPEPAATSSMLSAPAPAVTASESKPAIVSAAPAPTAAPIAPPVPRNVTAPSLLPAAPMKLAALKPEVLPVIAATEPASPVVQNKPVMPAAVPAV